MSGSDLTARLDILSYCNACGLREENAQLKIPMIPVHPKPNAKLIVVGRDPSPRTVTAVGTRGGKSIFVDEVFSLIDEAEISEDLVYITNMVKCHWRTSRGKPIAGTESRSPKIPNDFISTCIREWLFSEVKALKPSALISFGEEVYTHLRASIIEPVNPPTQLSASIDKSKYDAELKCSNEGPFTIHMAGVAMEYFPLRHPGNSRSLSPTEPRLLAYQKSRNMVVEKLRGLAR